MNKKPDMKGGRPKAKKGTLKRVLKFLFKSYKSALCIVLVCLVISALTNSISSIFTEKILSHIVDVIDIFKAEGAAAAMRAIYPRSSRSFSF